MKVWVTLAVTGVMLLGAWFVFKPASNQPQFVAAPAQADSLDQALELPGVEHPAGSEPTPARAGPVTADIEIRNGRLHSGPATVQLTQGQTVKLTVLSDRDDELHLHGYDIALQLRAGQRANLMLEATLSGRFEYEIHSTHSGIGALEVYPASN